MAAKCASHANGEFNLAVLEKQFSYEVKRNNLALNEVQNLAKIYMTVKSYRTYKKISPAFLVGGIFLRKIERVELRKARAFNKTIL